MNISTNDLHCSKPAHLLQLAQSVLRTTMTLSARGGALPHLTNNNRL
jgi:hypothetical protein